MSVAIGLRKIKLIFAKIEKAVSLATHSFILVQICNIIDQMIPVAPVPHRDYVMILDVIMRTKA